MAGLIVGLERWQLLQLPAALRRQGANLNQGPCMQGSGQTDHDVLLCPIC